MNDLKQENPPEDKLGEILGLLDHIEHTLKVRWVLFAAIWLSILMCAAATFLQWQALKIIKQTTAETDARSVRNEASIDAAMKQQVAYQQQLAQYWDYLYKKNPKVKVPRVIVRPPESPYPTPQTNPTPGETPPLFPLSDIQLERKNGVAKAQIVRKTPTRKTVKQPSPTPGPLERLFKPRSTR